MPPDGNNQKQTILVADDHEDTRVILRHYFEAMGYNVLEAHDGEQTLASMKGEHPDAVVLDIQMPRMDGIEVLRAVRGALRREDPDPLFRRRLRGRAGRLRRIPTGDRQAQRVRVRPR